MMVRSENLRPTCYSFIRLCYLTVLLLGPAGKLLELMDRHPYRPAHIHLLVRTCHWRSPSNLFISSTLTAVEPQVTCEGYRPLTTQIFDRKDPYLTNDSVFAVKESLIVDFVPRKDDPKAQLELSYDVKLVPDNVKANGA